MKKVLIFSMMLALFVSDALAFDPAEALKKKREQAAQQAAARERDRIEQHLTRYGEVQVHDNGTVTIQGKQWMRCSLGQQWTGSACTGTAVEASWDEAQDLVNMMNQAGGFAEFRDWRLPTIAELELLRLCSTAWTTGQSDLTGLTTGELSVFRSCGGVYSQPTIESTLFPNTPSDRYWSSSINLRHGHGSYALWVDFSDGNILSSPKVARYRVRLVRTGQ